MSIFRKKQTQDEPQPDIVASLHRNHAEWSAETVKGKEFIDSLPENWRYYQLFDRLVISEPHSYAIRLAAERAGLKVKSLWYYAV